MMKAVSKIVVITLFTLLTTMLLVIDYTSIGITESSINVFIELNQILKNFDITFDEGMLNDEEEKGKYGPYKQSNRKDIYWAYARKLIEEDLAYPSFATKEEIDKIREIQEKSKQRIGYYGRWAKDRFIPKEEAIEKIDELVKKDDVVLVKASRGMELEKIVEYLNK